MKQIAFGALRFDRSSLPRDLTDIGQWPAADDSALSDEGRDLLKRRIRAMTLFLDGHTPLRQISRETGVGFNDLYRVFERCITQHEDGRIFGCRALIPYQHTRSYDRRSPVKPSREGVASNASGAFTQLLQRYPDIARWIERKVAERSRKHAELTEVHTCGDCMEAFLRNAGRQVFRRTTIHSTRNTSLSDRLPVTPARCRTVISTRRLGQQAPSRSAIAGTTILKPFANPQPVQLRRSNSTVIRLTCA
ncbi:MULTISPECIES: hypothetical protein [Paraburkholderia]|uniref:hypothetical protein n=1 Tax=Paraburkholderia TaxID=1822464 RepID=UPI0038BAA246